MEKTEVRPVELKLIRPSPHNPRIFGKNDEALKELAQSIKEQGLISPVVVRPQNGHFELLAGERRFRAFKLAEAGSEIPAVVRIGISDEAAIALTVTENLQRQDLTPLEEANGVASLASTKLTTAEIADKLGKPLSWVARRARLANLSGGWRKLASQPSHPVSTWPASWLEIIALLEPAAQDAVLQEQENWRIRRIESAQDLHRLVGDRTRQLSAAIWKLDDAALCPKAGSCLDCPKRASRSPGLFDDVAATADSKLPKNDRCLDHLCWNEKATAAAKAKAIEIKAKNPDVVLVSQKGGDGAKRIGEFCTHDYGEGYAKVKAFVIDGPDAGKSITLYDSKKSEKHAAGEKPKKVKATPLSERMKNHELRRKAAVAIWVRDEISETFPKKSHSKNPEHLAIGMLIAVGSNHNDGYFTRGSAAAMRKFSGDLAAAARSAWEHVSRTMSRRINFNCLASVERGWEEVLLIAEFLGLDLKALHAKAEQELPIPKSWEKLNANGTPKDETPAKKAKAKARAK